MKKSLILALMAVGCAVIVFATDNVGSGSGTVWNAGRSRWKVKMVGANTTSVIDNRTGITNVLCKSAGEIGKIVFKPVTLNDELIVYDNATGSNLVESTQLYHMKALTDTLLGNFSTTVGQTITLPLTPSLGIPTVVDLAPGWSGANGITVVMKRSATSTLLEGWVSYDYAQ